jgi:hypothetical protein
MFAGAAFSLSASPTTQMIAVSGSVCFPIKVQNNTAQQLTVTLNASPADPSLTVGFSSSAACYPGVPSPSASVPLSASSSTTVDLIVTAGFAINARVGMTTPVAVAGSGGGSTVPLILTVTPEPITSVQNLIKFSGLNANSGDPCPLSVTVNGTTYGSVQCFSIQQNFWVYSGNKTYWAQDVVLLWKPQIPFGGWYAHSIFQVWLLNSSSGMLSLIDCPDPTRIPGIGLGCPAWYLLAPPLPPFWQPVGNPSTSNPLLISLQSTLTGNVITFSNVVNASELSFTSHSSQESFDANSFIGAGQVPTPPAGPGPLFEPQLAIVSMPASPLTLPSAQRFVNLLPGTSGTILGSTVTFSGSGQQTAIQSPIPSPAPSNSPCSSTEETSIGLFWNPVGLSGPEQFNSAFSSILSFPGEGITFVPDTGLTCEGHF